MEKFLFSLSLCFIFLAVPVLCVDDLNVLLKNELSKKCNNSSVNGVQVSIDKALDDKRICENKYNKEDQYYVFALKAIENGQSNTSALVNAYCNNSEEYFKCNEVFFKTFDKCLNEDDLKEVDVYTNLMKEVRNNLCLDDGDFLGDFLDAKGYECLMNNSDLFLNCTVDFDRNNYENSTISKNSMCLMATDIHKCAWPIILEKCDRDSGYFIQELYAAIVNEHLCEKTNGVDTNILSKLVILISILFYKIF